MAGFSVDTKLFRELGELLVGRESTALVELIKNAYDADATLVRIHGEKLDDVENGTITVIDDGVGMSEAEFRKGFLRIGGRAKSGEARRSPWFERSYTGEKGVGRLAAHKLARSLEVVSRRWNGEDRDDLDGFPAGSRLQATIDWDAIERLETLDQIDGSGAVVVSGPKPSRLRAGTELRMRRLRRAWTPTLMDRFLKEVATITPMPGLVAPLPKNLVGGPMLLGRPLVRDVAGIGDQFRVEYGGDFKERELEAPSSVERAEYVIEIDCDVARNVLRIDVEPTGRAPKNAEGFRLEAPIDGGSEAVSFQARIFERSGSWQDAAGVRVYFEGFRVLPYGEPNDDWLELERDARARKKGRFDNLDKFGKWELPPGKEKEELQTKSNKSFLGAVFLTKAGAGQLRMLVNREGFLPGAEMDFLRDTVRLAIDLQTRLRYLAIDRSDLGARGADGSRQERAAQKSNLDQAPTAFRLGERHRGAIGELVEARKAVAAGRVDEAVSRLAAAERELDEARALGGETASEATLYRILASMGLEHAAFVHEVNSLAGLAQLVGSRLDSLAEERGLTPDVRRRLKQLSIQMQDMRERLRRNAIYLADVTGLEGRRRRSRQSLRERFERALAHFARAAEARGVAVSNEIDEGLRTPPMFPAEVVAIMSNLLSNAIKFAGPGGRVRATGGIVDDRLVFRMENTGTAVDLRKGARWFEPFRSSTAEVDETLGQGMGLGLTITRSLVDEYGGVIEFVKPSPGFATAIEIRMSER